jgi:hypothetical protein
MPFHRNFTYWIDKRKWKYIFLLATLELLRTESFFGYQLVAKG